MTSNDLSYREKLLLSQSIHEFNGNFNWKGISLLLENHPLILRPKNYFSPDNCRIYFGQLLEEINLN